MHIPDGYLPAVICAAGYAVSGTISWASVKKLEKIEGIKKQIPKVALGTAAFLVSTLISIPVPPTSVHLALSGFMGIFLGKFSFLSILVALTFQTIMFGHGGITTLGINALIFGIPALLCNYFYSLFKQKINGKKVITFILGFFIGSGGTIISLIIFMFFTLNFIPIVLDPQAEKAALYTLSFAHLPIIIIEGIFTGFIINFFNKINPDMLGE